jgi:hypothetical protein
MSALPEPSVGAAANDDTDAAKPGSGSKPSRP